MKKLVLLSFLSFFLYPTTAFAADFVPGVYDPQNRFTSVGDILSAIFPIAIVVAGMIATLFVIWGGFRYMTAQGDPKAVEAARGTITSAVVGLVIVLAIGVLAALITGVFKFNILTGS